LRTARTMKTVTIAGIVASLALAGVAYRMNGGGGTGLVCLVGFGLGEYAAFQYFYYCSVRCPPLGEEGHLVCFDRCFVSFLIIQVILIVALVMCLFTFGFHF
jgi:hypothetical protein